MKAYRFKRGIGKGDREQREEYLATKQGGMNCYYCGKPLKSVSERRKNGIIIPDDEVHIEHRIPKSRGGNSKMGDNLVLSCRKCNLHKHTKTDKEFQE